MEVDGKSIEETTDNVDEHTRFIDLLNQEFIDQTEHYSIEYTIEGKKVKDNELVYNHNY